MNGKKAKRIRKMAQETIEKYPNIYPLETLKLKTGQIFIPAKRLYRTLKKSSGVSCR